ncbi:MAG: DNA polymerase III [Treponema sp.]|nr:DNA polymerase III [Treponema sp.]
MFDNVLHQSATDLLSDDILKNTLPQSLLFAGPTGAGKLTAALELARILGCTNQTRGAWNCSCPSCKKHKAMVNQSLLLCGPSSRTLEISAAKATLLSQNANATSHVEASRYLYLRAVRKLTLRFSPILWEGEDKLSKFSPILQAIDENLEYLEPGRTLPSGEELGKILDEIEEKTTKLEANYLYQSLPVSQIRNISSWAHLSSTSGKKVVIIENAEKMADSSRNALLKILEEPPADLMFILTTEQRGAMLPTILSRVRTYNFFERSREQQQEVINRVFHYDTVYRGKPVPDSINDFMQIYLPVHPSTIMANATSFFKTVSQGHVPDIPAIVSSCGNFEIKSLFKLFIEDLILVQKKLSSNVQGAAASAQLMDAFRKIYNDVVLYRQKPASALEELTREILHINRTNGFALRETFDE